MIPNASSGGNHSPRQLSTVVHDQPPLQVTRSELDGHVGQIYDVANDVGHQPCRRTRLIEFWKSLPRDGGPEVIQDGRGQESQPIEEEATIRLKHWEDESAAAKFVFLFPVLFESLDADLVARCRRFFAGCILVVARVVTALVTQTRSGGGGEGFR